MRRPRHDAAACSSASPPAPRSARWRCSASSPTARARRSGRCSPCASRSPRRCSGLGGAARRMPRCARDIARRARPRRVRLRAPGRAATSRRWSGSTRRCSRCWSTRSRRWSRSAAIALGRERLTRGGGRASLVVASGGLALVVGGRARARSTRSAPRSGSPPRCSTARYILVSDGIAARVPPHVLAALVCTGAAVALTVGAAALGEFRPGRADRAPAGAGSPAWRRSRPSARSGCSSPACARVGPTTRVDPRHRRAARHGAARVRSSSARRSGRCSSPAARSCSRAVHGMVQA